MGRPTIQMVEHWDVTKLTGWLKVLDPPLHSQDIEKIVEAEINGRVSLRNAGNCDFFQYAGLSFGASVLAELAKDISSTAIHGELLSFIPYSQH